MDHLIKKKWIVPKPYQLSGPSKIQNQSKPSITIRTSPTDSPLLLSGKHKLLIRSCKNL